MLVHVCLPYHFISLFRSEIDRPGGGVRPHAPRTLRHLHRALNFGLLHY